MIQIQRVSKSFGPVVALQDVSLEIARGDRVAFVGSNGSGKTTLLRALLGLLRVAGRVQIAGEDVAVRPELALRHVAYIPQISPPLEAPVRDVVAAYAALRGIDAARIEQQAQALGLTLAAIARARFRDLSGGMKQKLLASLALATDAEILVCDEPTANLDSAARAAFFARLEQRPAESIVIMCSHREEEVHNYVDRVIEMRDGRIARDERPSRTDAPRLQVAQ
jgi:ABC-type multidrug transport system ATPase subunit